MPYIVGGALIIGLTLGLMGSGGSILTLPVLTYLLGHDSKVAVAESLSIVGGIALLTLLPYAWSRLIDWRSVLFFGVPGMAGTYCGAKLAGFVSGALQLTLFAVVMLSASVMMLRKPRREGSESDELSGRHAKQGAGWIAAQGLGVGVVTGLVGVGGGFLIVPALVLLGGLPMRMAIGTSLAIITMNAASGSYNYQHVLEAIDAQVNWNVVVAFIAVGVLGSLAGKRLGGYVNHRVLRKAFAVFLLVMGLVVLGREAPRLMPRGPSTAATTFGLPRLSSVTAASGRASTASFSGGCAAPHRVLPGP
jgi:uncharacterized membrane protein YfcA